MTKTIKMKNKELIDHLINFGEEFDINIVGRKDGIAIKNTFALEIQVVEEHIVDLLNDSHDD